MMDVWGQQVKGIYFTWANDPPNAKIKDWNVTELKVCTSPLLFIDLTCARRSLDRPAPKTRGQVGGGTFLENHR